jgi:uncharacterized protein YaaN involved in tellurite resistance
MELGNVDAWIELGLPGAALLLVLIVFVYSIKMYGSSLDKLCKKLDKLIDSNAENNALLNEMLISNNKDLQHLSTEVEHIHKALEENHTRLIQIEAKLPSYIRGEK